MAAGDRIGNWRGGFGSFARDCCWPTEKTRRFLVGRAVRMHHQTIQRCVERALAYGAMAALDDRPRPGREATIIAEAKAWVVDLACRKAKDLGYPHELWRCSPAMRVSMGRQRGTLALPSWLRARCETSSISRTTVADWA